MHDLDALLTAIFEEQNLILAVLSSPFEAREQQKITLRPLQLKGSLVYQATVMRQQQALHQNYSPAEALALVKEAVLSFKQSVFYTSQADYQVLVNKKKHATILKKRPSKVSLPLTHNRPKNYLLEEGTPIPFLVQLGVMNTQGRVHAQKRDKFRQINRFLELVEDILPQLGKDTSSLYIIDFGCGKAYLTFALYHFLKVIKGFAVKMTGIDLKQDVIAHCQQIAHDLGYGQDLTFRKGDINSFETEQPVDLVVSLHACDTATDAALEKAIRWQARAILSVPCCQHELYSQVKQEALAPLLAHGILKERFAALATDAARVQLLEALGYQTQILEFIDMEHTAKNLLIRAVRRPSPRLQKLAWQSYLKFKEALSIFPSLEKRFKNDLSALFPHQSNGDRLDYRTTNCP